jgi:hypothetical protein
MLNLPPLLDQGGAGGGNLILELPLPNPPLYQGEEKYKKHLHHLNFTAAPAFFQ